MNQKKAYIIEVINSEGQSGWVTKHHQFPYVLTIGVVSAGIMPFESKQKAKTFIKDIIRKTYSGEINIRDMEYLIENNIEGIKKVDENLVAFFVETDDKQKLCFNKDIGFYFDDIDQGFLIFPSIKEGQDILTQMGNKVSVTIKPISEIRK